MHFATAVPKSGCTGIAAVTMIGGFEVQREKAPRQRLTQKRHRQAAKPVRKVTDLHYVLRIRLFFSASWLWRRFFFRSSVIITAAGLSSRWAVYRAMAVLLQCEARNRTVQQFDQTVSFSWRGSDGYSSHCVRLIAPFKSLITITVRAA